MGILIKTLETLGTLMIAFAALSVHHKVKEEKKIDDFVLKLMNLEWKVGILGIILIIIAFSLHIFYLV